jgi:hypothetical protein
MIGAKVVTVGGTLGLGPVAEEGAPDIDVPGPTGLTVISWYPKLGVPKGGKVDRPDEAASVPHPASATVASAIRAARFMPAE